MKKKQVIKMVFLTGIAMVLFAGNALAAMSGTDHDFSSAGWNPGGEICVVCHTPHNAASDSGDVDVPLWNHMTTTATFTTYSSVSSTLDATMGQPAGVSKACLSCHDGTIALDAFGGTANNTTNRMTAGDHLLGTDLSNDHPVSFTYDTALSTADGHLADPSTVNSGLGGTIAADMLVNNRVECSSCHDVHDDANVAKFLVKSNAASALCLTCHNK